MSNLIDFITEERYKDERPIWVDPVGGLGDILMLSTAMKRAYDRYGRRFNVARRTRYTEFFKGHPAVAEIGNPPEDADIVRNDYWSRPDFGDVNLKALELVSRIFGVADSPDDALYLPEREPEAASRLMIDNIPWGERNVMIAFSSDSPRKMMHPMKWHIIVERLLSQRCFVIQVGGREDIPIKGAYTLVGTTAPLQIMDLMQRIDLVITPDNYIMHAARAAGKPAIALFGPTEPERYGYSTHVCIQADKSHCSQTGECLGPHVADNYSTPCPLCEQHCMDKIDENKVVDIAMTILNKD